MCCSSRGLWRAIAVFSMVLSLVVIAAAITGILAYHCAFNPGVSAFRMDNVYFTYVAYFYNLKCLDSYGDYIVQNRESSDRTFYWAIAYLVVNTLWLFSALLLFNATRYWKSPVGLWMTYPYLFMTFAVICEDAAASAHYGLDYDNVKTSEKLFSFLGLMNSQTLTSFEYYPYLFIIMVGFFSKAIVLWVMEIFCFFAIYVMLVKVGKSEEHLMLQTRASAPDYYTRATMSNPAFENDGTDIDFSRPQSPLAPLDMFDDRNQYREDISWNNEPRPRSNLSNMPSIPRVPMRQTEESQDFEDQWVMRPDTPKSYTRGNVNESGWMFLKTPYDGRSPQAAYNGQKPWSYLSSPIQPDSNSSFDEHANNRRSFYY